MELCNSSGFESNPPYIVRKVEFINVQDHYCCDEDLICEYILIDHKPEEHDRISVYKLGWSQVKEYVLFEWAPLSKKGEVQRVIFNRPSLPKNTPDLMYHFCYINADNQVLGASAPFQFCADLVKMSTSVISLPNITNSLTSFYAADSTTSHEKDKEIALLKKELAALNEENSLLKSTLKLVVQDNINRNRVQKEVEDLKNVVEVLQKALQLQQNEISGLKARLSEQDTFRTTEKLKSLNIVELGELETLPPFPKYL